MQTMNNLRILKHLAIGALLLTGSVSWAQPGTPVMSDPATTGVGGTPVNPRWETSLVRDGAFDKVPHRTIPLDWQYLREADALWKKRVWREIDVREKQNEAFIYPGDDETGGGMFIEIVMNAIRTGKAKAYGTVTDRFTRAFTVDQVNELVVGRPDTNYVDDPNGGPPVMRITQNDFNPEKYTSFRVKEDWIFDRNLGRMVVRIIGIAPMEDVVDPVTGLSRGFSKPVFWLYYPELRKALAQYEVYNPENDVQRLTWDDYLEGRFWNGRIIQTSSNNSNSPYSELGINGTQALYQAQRDMEEIVNKEIDMWQY